MGNHTLSGYSNKKSRTKTEREDEITSILKLNKDVDTLTKDDFSKIKQDGNDVEEIYTHTLSKSVANLIGINTDKDLILVNYKNPIYVSSWMTTDDAKSLMDDTALFFDLSCNTLAENKLLFKISNEIYTNGYRDKREGSLNVSYQKWKRYCSFIDKIKPYIYTIYSKKVYDKEQGKVRDSIYEASKIFKNTFLDNIIDFLQDYDLNQTKTAKVDALLELNIPHICDKKTAEHFVNIYLSTNSPQTY